MGKGGKKTKTNTTSALDPQSQAYVDSMRGYGAQAGELINREGSYFTGPQSMSIGDQVSPFMNPYIQNVVDSTRGEFDHLRGQASTRTSQGATAAGAFGGSRHGVAEGVRLGELDRAQTSQIGGLLQSGYNSALSNALPYWEQQRQLEEQQLQEPFWRQRQGLSAMNLGMGPTGWNTSQTSRESGGSTAGNVMGAIQTGMGLWDRYQQNKNPPPGGPGGPGPTGPGGYTIPGDPTYPGGGGSTNTWKPWG